MRTLHSLPKQKFATNWADWPIADFQINVNNFNLAVRTAQEQLQVFGNTYGDAWNRDAWNTYPPYVFREERLRGFRVGNAPGWEFISNAV